MKVIQAEHGDALVVSYGKDPVYHLLVDGGPENAFPNLLSVLESLRQDGILILEAIVISHYDNDHIGGIIRLLRNAPDWLKINDIWFNGRKHISPSDSLGVNESDELSFLIEKGGYFWNKAFDNKAVKANFGRSIRFNGGMDAWVLSPMQEQLNILAKNMPDILKGDVEFLNYPKDRLGRKDVWPAPSIVDLASANYVRDTSASNGSSIAIMLKFNEKNILLAADSFAEVVVKGIEEYWGNRIDVEVLKISHHGSQANTSDVLLKTIRCRRFIISTNGKIHAHPDQSLIARLLSNIGHPEIIFNYHTSHTARWNQPPRGWPAYTTIYPCWNEPFVRVII